MNKTDKIALSILSLFLAVFVFVTSVSLIISTTFCSPKFMIKVLENKDYYSIIYSEYSDSLEDGIAIPAGVDEGVLSAVISKDEITADINNIIEVAYSKDIDNSQSLDYDAVKQRFYDTMVAFFTNKGIEITDEISGDILNVATHCADEYKGYSEMPFIYTIGGYAIDLLSIFRTVSIVFGCISIFLIVLLLITKKWRSSAMFVMGISSFTVGLLLIIAPICVLIIDVINRINIQIKSLYTFAVGYANSLLYVFIAVGGLFVIIALILAFFEFVLPLIKLKKDKN